MSKPKLTPWFPGSINPVRSGVYEVKRSTYTSPSLIFKGRLTYTSGRWYYVRSEYTIRVAAPIAWRGLAKEPQ